MKDTQSNNPDSTGSSKVWFSKHRDILTKVGYYFLAHGEMTKARTIFRVMRDYDAGNSYAVRILAYIEAETGQYETSIGYVEQHRVIDPNSDFNVYLVGILNSKSYLALNRREEAINAFSTYLQQRNLEFIQSLVIFVKQILLVSIVKFQKYKKVIF